MLATIDLLQSLVQTGVDQDDLTSVEDDMKQKLYGTTAAAELLEKPLKRIVAVSTIIRVAERHDIGQRPEGLKQLVFTKDEVDELAKLIGEPGNPNFTEGNYFGEPAPRKRRRRKK